MVTTATRQPQQSLDTAWQKFSHCALLIILHLFYVIVEQAEKLSILWLSTQLKTHFVITKRRLLVSAGLTLAR